jgi:hypothetical protein
MTISRGYCSHCPSTWLITHTDDGAFTTCMTCGGHPHAPTPPPTRRRILPQDQGGGKAPRHRRIQLTCPDCHQTRWVDLRERLSTATTIRVCTLCSNARRRRTD